VVQIFAPSSIGTRTLVLAHRGASRVERENTVLAFQRAGDMGADGVELDVRTTADGKLVVHHDPFLADGRVICEVLAADLLRHIPSLNEALDACAGMWVNVEIKNDANEPDFDPLDHIAQQVCSELVARGENERFLISSFRRETIDKVREEAPSLRTAWLVRAVLPDDYADTAKSLAEAGHVAIHPWVGLLSAEMVDAFHSAQLQVNTWTCDDPQRMAELAEWGVDAICTNTPDVALEVLRRLSRR